MGASASRTSTKFRREGTSTQDFVRSLPETLSALLQSNASTSAPSTALSNRQDSFISALLQTNPSGSIPNSLDTQALASQDVRDFPGFFALNGIANQDLSSGAYKDATQAEYEQNARDALAQLFTGPAAVRGAGESPSIAAGILSDRLAQGRGRELRAAQDSNVGRSMNAAQMLSTNEMQRQGAKLQAQSLLAANALQGKGLQVSSAGLVDARRANHNDALGNATQALGGQTITENNNLRGDGSQTSFSAGFQACCWLYLTATEGVDLPWFVEAGRRDFYTPTRRRGYKWMSWKLIPWMERFTLLRKLVKHLVVEPIRKYGAWLYMDESAKPHYKLYGPYVKTWFKLWETLGKCNRFSI